MLQAVSTNSANIGTNDIEHPIPIMIIPKTRRLREGSMKYMMIRDGPAIANPNEYIENPRIKHYHFGRKLKNSLSTSIHVREYVNGYMKK